MIGLVILFWVVTIFLLLVFMIAILGSVSNKNQGERRIDLIVGLVLFFMFLLVIKVFGGYIV